MNYLRFRVAFASIFLFTLFTTSCSKDNDVNEENIIAEENGTSQEASAINNPNISGVILSSPNNITIVNSTSSGMVFSHDMTLNIPNLLYLHKVDFYPQNSQSYDKLLVFNNTNIDIGIDVASRGSGYPPYSITIAAGGSADINVESAFMNTYGASNITANAYNVLASTSPITGTVNTYLYYDYY